MTIKMYIIYLIDITLKSCIYLPKFIRPRGSTNNDNTEPFFADNGML